MLEKAISYDHTIMENGCIHVRQITRILEDGEEISKAYHRCVVSPGDNVEGHDDRTVLLVETIHSPELITKFKAKKT